MELNKSKREFRTRTSRSALMDAALNHQAVMDLTTREQIPLQAIRLARRQSKCIKMLLNHEEATIKENACNLAPALVYSGPARLIGVGAGWKQRGVKST